MLDTFRARERFGFEAADVRGDIEALSRSTELTCPRQARAVLHPLVPEMVVPVDQQSPAEPLAQPQGVQAVRG